MIDFALIPAFTNIDKNKIPRYTYNKQNTLIYTFELRYGTLGPIQVVHHFFEDVIYINIK
jgi:hypothetical protein